ncbi:hypothetical protein H6P81_019408 [Aristolochia fimbriata]|uniref:Uncharacterized protein n=1 Tax=Aristolochia fimbriata TaxID=158543 RepID=A0AAV7DSL4_ARIFI|nr:hypothetical protein H6P81_019408 [Aristolochia fimbriata]
MQALRPWLTDDWYEQGDRLSSRESAWGRSKSWQFPRARDQESWRSAESVSSGRRNTRRGAEETTCVTSNSFNEQLGALTLRLSASSSTTRTIRLASVWTRSGGEQWEEFFWWNWKAGFIGVSTVGLISPSPMISFPGLSIAGVGKHTYSIMW